MKRLTEKSSKNENLMLLIFTNW